MRPTIDDGERGIRDKVSGESRAGLQYIAFFLYFSGGEVCLTGQSRSPTPYF